MILAPDIKPTKPKIILFKKNNKTPEILAIRPNVILAIAMSLLFIFI